MVNAGVTDAAADPAMPPDRRLALSIAPAAARGGLAALFALDDRLAAVVRTTREPLVGQMRLTWWHAALTALDEGPPPAEPVLHAIADDVLPHGVSAARLATMIDGWEALLDGATPDAAAMTTFAAARGGGLFAAAAAVLGAEVAAARAGEVWALADLSRNLSDPGARAAAGAMAEARIAGLFRPRWGRAGRPLGVLTIAAMLDLQRRSGLRRAARLAAHLATGG